MRGISAINMAPKRPKTAGTAVEVIDVSETPPPPDPLGRHGAHSSRQSGTRILLLCPTCQRDRRLVSLSDDRQVIEPWLDDPVPDDDTEPVVMDANGSDHRDRSGLPTCGPARSTPGPRRDQIGLGAAPGVIPLSS
jgi:hypothetical protein